MSYESSGMIRQPIVTVLGHVDHGKTSLLDYIRQSRVQLREAGGITQHIGATEVPAEFIKERCGTFLSKLGIAITIPGLLFIDTPGHEAFMNLRRRGGSLADLAVLVIDITQGLQPQTVESIEILKHFKVPFVIGANKIDLVKGWKSDAISFIESWKKQDEDIKLQLESMLYEIMGKLAGLGYDSERFDRVADFTKQVAIVPVCAKTGEGVMDLLAVIAGLAQRYLQTQLETVKGPARGTILEIKQEKGLGTVLDSVIYDGVLHVGDEIVVGGLDGVLKGKVKLLLKPKALDEMRDPRDRFTRVPEVAAASGIRIVAQGCEAALAGSLLISTQLQDAEQKVMEDLQAVKIETTGSGIVLKADALGSLEAVAGLAKNMGIKIRMADIGDVSRKDVVEAESASQDDPLTSAIIAFHVNILPDAEKLASDNKIKIIRGEIIYQLFENYQAWVKERKEQQKKLQLEKLGRGCKFTLLPGYVFRQSKPAIVGVEILGGILKPGAEVINLDGKVIGHVKGLQDKGESIPIATKGQQVAASIEGPTIGRQIKEKDVLFTQVIESEYKKLKEFKDLVEPDELEILEEFKQLMRDKVRKTWGM